MTVACSTLVGIIIIWMLAWGSLTVANVARRPGGRRLLLLVSPDRVRSGGRVASGRSPSLRFIGYVVVQVVRSNVVLVGSVIARRSRVPHRRDRGAVAGVLRRAADGGHQRVGADAGHQSRSI